MAIKKTLEEVQNEIDNIFGPSSYLLVKEEYKGNKIKSAIKCLKCSLVFHRIPYDFKKSLGCPECSSSLKGTLISDKKSKENEEDILKLLHTKYVNYSFSFINSFVNRSNSSVQVTCKVHSTSFEVNVKSLLRKGSSNVISCPKCIKDLKKDTTESFIKKLDKTHPNIFNTSSLTYLSAHEAVSVTCCKCKKETVKKAYSLLQSSGCNYCTPKSLEEESVKDYIRTLLPNIVVESNRPTWMDKKELDIFIKEYNLAIEYNGTIYHHSSNSHYLSDFLKKTSKDSKYHFNKWKSCFENNVTLLSIYDFYWQNPIKREIYKSKIRHYLKLDTKVFARTCTIKEIENKIAYSFYETNHLEGKGLSYKDSQSFGLYSKDNELLMCCTIGKFYNQSSKTFKLKLHRICTLLDYTVVGGINKLSSYLLKSVGSFTYQITLSSGGSSLKANNNFTILSPRYFWVNRKDISQYHHRNFCQKSLLEKHFKQPLLQNDTENSYMERLGYLKVYDNGLAEIKLDINNK